MDKSSAQNSCEIGQVSLPKGGGAYAAMGEKFEVQKFTGSAGFSIPVYATPCRGYEPQISLTYQSGSGNSEFGMGFTLNVPCIGRQTSRRIPAYDQTDIFISSVYGELTKIKGQGYAPVEEGSFAKITFEEHGNFSRWIVITGKGETEIYGGCSNCIVADLGGRVFQWLLSETRDRRGNRTRYVYKEDKESRFLKTILYGNTAVDDASEFCFRISFSYVSDRADAFASCRSGFLLRTRYLCSSISMIHCFESRESVVRSMLLEYNCQSGISLLTRVRQVGSDGDEGLPPLELDYQHVSHNSARFYPLKLNESDFPLSFHSKSLYPVDLYGEGISGLLYCDGTTILYYEPLGDGRYGEPVSLEEFPSDSCSKSGYSLRSLQGDGCYDLVVERPERTGFYSLRHGKWSGFQPFLQYPNMHSVKGREFAEIQGDGLGHLVFVFQDSLSYFPSKGREGTGAPVTCPVPDGFPPYGELGKVKTAFEDMLGDGLSHRVQVKNGSVECWPALGRGKFGEKIAFRNPPVFQGDFDPDRLFFADTDGTGAQDLVYVYGSQAAVYLNQGGSGFLDPFFVTLPGEYTNADKISFADVLGAGYQCMIFTKMEPCVKNYFLDFHQGKKPYLLKQVNNHMGCMTNIEYESSVTQYLRDKRRGITWRCQSPFPVQVVSQIEVIDTVSKTVSQTDFHYRNGFYHKDERSFQGFGYVEEISRETVKDFAYHSPSVCRKAWYYTGGSQQRPVEEFYHGDPLARRMPEDMLCGDSGQTLALRGRIIRHEVYQMDENKKTDIPMSVDEYRYLVTMPHERANGAKASYCVQDMEQIHYTYEQIADDPRVTCDFFLEYDRFSNCIRCLRLYLPRRQNALYGQSEARAMLTVNFWYNCQESGSYAIGLLCESKDYEVYPISADIQNKELFEQVKAHTDAALNHQAAWGMPFTGKFPQARIEKWERLYYWNSSLTGELPFGEAAAPFLEHHREQAVFSEQFLAAYPQIDHGMLKKDCGYDCREGFYWNQGMVTCYDRERFCLPVFQKTAGVSADSLLYHRTDLKYDSYSLLPVEVKRYLEEGYNQTERYGIDYRSMSYQWHEDCNGVRTEYLLDSFGVVRASSVYETIGKEREGFLPLDCYIPQSADFDSVIANKAAFVQKAYSFFYYDLESWEKKGIPVRCVHLENDPDTELSGGRIRCRVTFFDGKGRITEQKDQEEDGWYSAGRKLYLGTEREIMGFLPYRSDSPDFDTDKKASPVITWYDCHERVVAVQKPSRSLPDGGPSSVLSAIEYYPWEIRSYDFNDKIQDSAYFRDFYTSLPDKPSQDQLDQKDALEKGMAFADTPRRSLLDVMGQKTMDYMDSGEKCAVCYDYSIHAQLLKIESRDGHVRIRYYPTMTKEAFGVQASDSGMEISLTDLYGQRIHSFDARGCHLVSCHDRLGRLTQMSCEERIVRRIEYGDLFPDARERNLAGRPWKSFDQGGVETVDAYHFTGLPLTAVRRFCTEYRKPADWSQAGETALEPEEYREETRYNLLGNPIRTQQPDGSCIEYGYDLRGNLFRGTCYGPDGKEYAGYSTSYNASGQELETKFKNGVSRRCTYDPQTQLLTELQTTGADGKLMEWLSYYYDPEGNITRLRDRLSDVTYHNQQSVEALRDYTYDERYRLIQAMGRVLPSAADPWDYGRMERYRRSYTYDGAGNLTAVSHRAPSDSWSLAMELDKSSNRLVKAGDTVVSSDESGNPFMLPGIRSLSWDYGNHLVGVRIIQREKGSDDCEYYIYDPSGIRLRKITEIQKNGVAQITDHIYLPGYERKRVYEDRILLDRQSISLMRGDFVHAVCHRWEVDERKRETDVIRRTMVHYQLADCQQSVGMELDESGEVITKEEFFPYGATAVSFGSSMKLRLKKYRYCGKEKDSVSGLYYYGARYYSSMLGRFISADSLEYVSFQENQSLNRYCYCNNNPVTRCDLDGHIHFHIFYGNDQSDKAQRDCRKLQEDGHQVTLHHVRNARALAHSWNQTNFAPGDIVVFFAHGFSKGVTVKTSGKKWVNGMRDRSPDYLLRDQQIGGLVLFSCNGANIKSGDQINAAQSFLQMPGISDVLACRGCHQADLVSDPSTRDSVLAHQIITVTRDNDHGFYHYARQADGRTTVTKLGSSFYYDIGKVMQQLPFVNYIVPVPQPMAVAPPALNRRTHQPSSTLRGAAFATIWAPRRRAAPAH